MSTNTPAAALSKKANMVAAIFNALSWAVLIIGGLTALIGAIIALSSDQPAAAIPAILLSVVYTGVAWASVSLGTIVARFIAIKS